MRQGLQHVKEGVGCERALQEPQQGRGLPTARRRATLGKVLEDPGRAHLECCLVRSGEFEKVVDGVPAATRPLGERFRHRPKRRDALPVVAAQRGGDVHRG